VLALAVWLLFQALMTLAVAQSEEGIGLGCSEDLPKIALIATTVAAGGGLVLGIVPFWGRRLSAAWWAVVASVGFAALWVLYGGFDAFGCVLAI
jgi:hypothetical protein